MDNFRWMLGSEAGSSGIKKEEAGKAPAPPPPEEPKDEAPLTPPTPPPEEPKIEDPPTPPPEGEPKEKAAGCSSTIADADDNITIPRPQMVRYPIKNDRTFPKLSISHKKGPKRGGPGDQSRSF